MSISKNSITCIILTLNEEKNIERCVSGLKQANRIIVVDSGSQDNTTRLAEKLGCEVYYNPWNGFAHQRNWALRNTNILSDWVLFLDADEQMTTELWEEILQKICSENFCAYYLCSKIIFLGKWVRRSYGFPKI